MAPSVRSAPGPSIPLRGPRPLRPPIPSRGPIPLRVPRPLRALSLVAAFLAATTSSCADLAFIPEHVPTSLALTPSDTLVAVGDVVAYRLVVLDQNGDSVRPAPAWARPVWTTSNASAVRVSPDGVVETLRGADASVSVSVAGLSASSRLRINPPNLVLSAPAVHLTQGIQRGNGLVPLIAGRQALLRVFVTGDQVSFYRPQVHAFFWQANRLVHSVVMHSESDVLSNFVQEGRLDRSHNAVVPGDVLQPGVTMVVELNRDGSVPLAPGSTVRWPAEDRIKLDVRALPRLDLTVVPVLVASDSSKLALAWVQDIGADSEHLHLTRSALPVGELNVAVREPFTTSVDLTSGAGWGELLTDLTFLHRREGERGYYYGAVALPAGSNWTGLGYIGEFRVSVGAPDGATLAHELGHNFGLRHAPCGGANGPDRGYPYDDGSIGVWGYDFRNSRLVNPTLYKDVMGYCYPSWMSDYHFSKAMAYRLATEASALPDGAGLLNGAGRPESRGWETTTRRTKSLVLRGTVGNGMLRLEPAFLMEMAPEWPSGGGPYRLEGYGPAGEPRFSFSFAPTPLEFGGGGFFFALPYDPARDGALTRVALSGPDGHRVLEESGAEPVAVFTDRATGRMRAVLRGWTGEATGSAAVLDGTVDVTVSYGLPPEVATPGGE